MKIKMTIESETNEEIKYEELKIELDYLSKQWDIFFKKYLSGWEIIGYPKGKIKMENRK